MSTSAIATAISASLSGRRLLDHPYYRAWQEGDLARSDLKGYAEQYRHFERCLPEALSTAVDRMEESHSRRLVEANLEDEMSQPRCHLELFDDFARAVGAGDRVGATAATSELVELYRDAAEHGPVALLSVVGAYEAQAAEIAATKAGSLSLHYGLDQAATGFWTIHAEVEHQHAEWTVEALAGLGAETHDVSGWALRSARAWWEFLDEREASRAA